MLSHTLIRRHNYRQSLLQWYWQLLENNSETTIVWSLHVQKKVVQDHAPSNKFNSHWYPRGRNVSPASPSMLVTRRYSTRQYIAIQFLARLITFLSVCWRKYGRHSFLSSLQFRTRSKYSFSKSNTCFDDWVGQAGGMLLIRLINITHIGS